jgi:hypothetical protein
MDCLEPTLTHSSFVPPSLTQLLVCDSPPTTLALQVQLLGLNLLFLFFYLFLDCLTLRIVVSYGRNLTFTKRTRVLTLLRPLSDAFETENMRTRIQLSFVILCAIL